MTCHEFDRPRWRAHARPQTAGTHAHSGPTLRCASWPRPRTWHEHDYDVSVCLSSSARLARDSLLASPTWPSCAAGVSPVYGPAVWRVQCSGFSLYTATEYTVECRVNANIVTSNMCPVSGVRRGSRHAARGRGRARHAKSFAEALVRTLTGRWSCFSRMFNAIK